VEYTICSASFSTTHLMVVEPMSKPTLMGLTS
jgi:hypothetical protein